jgi:BMFP domain-containing protein YqiC
MPSIPDDMSAAAVERRAKLTAKMRALEAKKAAATPPAAPKPRIAKGR